MPIAPIADLTYRTYDGPLAPPGLRWWVIARMGIQLAMRKRSLWVASAFAGWYYLVMITILFFVDQNASAGPQGKQAMDAFMNRVVWKDQFLHGFSYAQLVILLTALLIGAGAIANDNRANALLVYLSKPCTKLDYLIGKWVGIFLPLLVMMAIPTAVFYGYGFLSFSEAGFLKDDPWLGPKLMLILPLSAALHTSLILAVSSLFRQGRIAGATYAGLYFLGNFFTQLMYIPFASSGGNPPAIVKTLFYCSIDGLQIGLAKAILGTNGTPPFGIPRRGGMVAIDAPPLLPMLAVITVVIGVCLAITWSRIRAVEVVG